MNYYSKRSPEALTNALERLLIAIKDSDLRANTVLLFEYHRACDLLGYDPAKAQWSKIKGINISHLPNDEDHGITYFPQLNPEE
jgi:hypothetical protein